MGRIQRKKAPGDKNRKKQREASGANVQSTKGSAPVGSKGTGLSETAKAIKKGANLAVRKSPAAGSAVSSKKPGDGVFAKAIQFLREVKVELKKVAWPSRKQTLGSTAVVIVLVVLISLFLGVVDMGLSTLIRLVLK